MIEKQPFLPCTAPSAGRIFFSHSQLSILLQMAKYCRYTEPYAKGYNFWRGLGAWHDKI